MEDDRMAQMTAMLTNLLPYLDKHLALGLVDYYGQKGLDVTDALTRLIESTGLMVDGTVKPEHEKLIAATTAVAKPALDAFFDRTDDAEYTYQFRLTASEIEQLRAVSELSLEHLAERKQITKAVMVAVMQLAFLYYDKGAYVDAAELLALCRCVSGYDLPVDTLLWGKLMCDTGACNWQSAIDVAEQLRRNQNVDEKNFRQAKLTTVRDRAWLMHWVLFAFFKGGSQYTVHLLYYVFDMKTENVYRSVVETVCPHLLRYICAAALLNRTRYVNFRNAAAMADTVYEYSDALTRLVSLINKPAFEEALALLPEVQALVQDDYFLCDLEDELLQSAKRMIFQRYMAVHAVVSIPYVADRLGMSSADAEVWLVNLISDSKQRAKIDSVNEQLNVEPQTRSVESVVFDKIESASRK